MFPLAFKSWNTTMKYRIIFGSNKQDWLLYSSVEIECNPDKLDEVLNQELVIFKSEIPEYSSEKHAVCIRHVIPVTN